MTKLNTEECRSLLKQGKFVKLFTQEVGWDHFRAQTASIAIGDEVFALVPVAEKRGVQIFAVTGSDGSLPTLAARRGIEREVTKIAAEHLLIFHDSKFKEQVWQWVSRKPNHPAQVREVALHAGQSGEALLQKLEHITFALSDEEAISIVLVTQKLKDAFDRDTVTKKFYERFQREHAAFHDLIDGVTDGDDKRWYASVMVNRVMFLYFVQSKRFLNQDPNYLQKRLEGSATKYGANKFYQSFLCPLFFEGLAKREAERDPAIRADLGKIPYLSGSLFVEHEIEARNTEIDIPDGAFEKLFAFLSEYNWHLDDRPVADGKHINPDVLGYIFEKYINQKQMGAYYTKEDITEYISKNTILPFVLERAKEKCEVAFAGEYSVWRLLAEDPDRYIYPAMRHGANLPLPANIEAGVTEVAKRGDWNKPAPSDYALPTEIWRETVARRQRYAEVRGKLKRGEVTSTNDLITLNLDIRQFTQDVVERYEGTDLLRAVWETLNGTKDGSVPPLSVLDPTCGSGAFLFAAVEILQPLYVACVEKMRGFVEDADRLGRTKEHQAFRDVMAEMLKHPSETYYMLKKIITHNLFGVDIMEEATEICKLRLFLKLAAEVEPDSTKDNLGIEPLPDIDFNIRPGNTLIGFATEGQMHHAVTFGGSTSSTGSLALEGEDEKWRKFKADLEVYDKFLSEFLGMQERGDFASAFAEQQKAGLKARIQPLRDQADELLSNQYVQIGAEVRSEWRKSIKPFHWFVEFYRNMRSDGFDCIVGNPPYLEKSKLRGMYEPKDFSTKNCKDIYAWVVERATTLISGDGCCGLIVPISAASSPSFDVLRIQIRNTSQVMWFSNFSNRPGQLFEGAQNRLTIVIFQSGKKSSTCFSTRYHRWDAKHGERKALFQQLTYAEVELSLQFHSLIPKAGQDPQHAILKKVLHKRSLNYALSPKSLHVVYWIRVPGYFCQFFLTPPMARPETGGTERVRGELNALYFFDETKKWNAFCALNSNLYYYFFNVFTDCRHINPNDVKDFPIEMNSMSDELSSQLTNLAKSLAAEMVKHKKMTRKSGLLIDSLNSQGLKPIYDKIDHTLVAHYDFTEEELDFIINYDIKYRMGRGSDDSNAED